MESIGDFDIESSSSYGSSLKLLIIGVEPFAKCIHPYLERGML
ncbi:hypothetical protein [Lactococcus petauri]|uniref:Uncharacterized protein n=1 Tax=Lactococcus petauri TaxID=1940789 RepID=A0AAJ2IYE0_9LACT|nr:hypothetical protein [Lactococcus petauri]MDT2967791.1 hypothetical protein [Lactococcus lactis]MDT2527297.1 hypothetical protein [Lactococcus petauri]MDT2542040.1 hypothetical protein [Lactococcus petauri]MDT2558639.1 hypothetical protein [Lactococcus petauri]MDT2560748.1 hypothetical protein [Lactococcus petauri]